MKYHVKYSAILALSSLALAQSTTTSSTEGVTPVTVVSSDHTQTLLTQSINGRQVPMKQTETHLLSKTATGSVTETLVRRYDQNGQLSSTQKIVTEVENRPGGSTTTSTTYDTDINGNFSQTERKTVDTEMRGQTTDVNTVIERPSINGGLQTAQKTAAVIENKPDASHEDETVYRPDGNGGFSVAERRISDTTHKNNETTQTTALYQPIAESSKLQLSRQQVTRTVQQADGSEQQVVEFYLPSIPGVVRDPNAPPQLWEQQTIQRKPGPDNTVEQTVVARRTDPNHPNQLGAPEQISKTVCQGDCSGQ